MSKETVHETLFEDAKVAVGRLCFDISVDKNECYQSACKLKVELTKMMAAIVPLKDLTP